MPESSRSDDRALRRTQLTIAVVRTSFAVVVSVVIGIVLLNGDHNEDRYEIPATEWEVRLWQLLVLALVVLGIVFVGGVSDLARAVRRRRIL